MSIINPSNTPLKRYPLLCPKCDTESVVLPGSLPDEPFCTECNEDIDLDDLQEFIESWLDYLQDRAALLEQEKGKKHESNK